MTINPQPGANQELTVAQILAMQSVISGDTPRWSPDGSRIMFVSSLGGTADLWSVSPDRDFPQRMSLGMGDVSFLASRIPLWSPDGRYASYLSQKSGNDEVWLWPTNGAEFQLTHLGGQINSMNWSPDGRSIIVANNRHGSYDIYKVEVPSGESVRLTSDSRYEVNPVSTPDGQSILYVRMNESWEDHQIVRMNQDGSEPCVIVQDSDFFDYSYGGTFGYPLVSPNGDSALFRSQRSGFTNIWNAPLNGGDPQPISPEEADQSEPAWSPNGRLVAYVSNHNGTLSLRIADARSGESRDIFSPPTGVCSAPQWSPDGNSISFMHGAPTAPNDLWVVSVEKQEARQLTCSIPAGSLQSRFAEPRKVEYQSFDGLKINAYLYAPRDRSEYTKYPGILFIHGGPTSQFVDDLQLQVQHLVQRGYVVLLPNIRGSSGYGKAFEELNDGDWGHSDLKDVLAGAEFLKGLDYVDADNMGITGTSYGGIMSMCAVCFTPGSFQAAAPMSGYADWPELRHEVELRHLKLMDHEFGPYEQNSEAWRRSSPIYTVGNATTPCFVLHGEGDEPRSNASRAFVHRMRQHYKTVRYKTYLNEGYYVRSTENLRQMFTDVADFFDYYLKGE